MAVFRETTLTWQGKDHSLVPSIALLRKVDGRLARDNPGCNSAAVAFRLVTGGANPTEVAIIGGEMLRAAGADVSDEDVYSFYLSSAVEDIVAFNTQLLECVIPTGEKTPAPKKTRTRAK